MDTRLQSANPEILETLQLLTALKTTQIPECSAAVILGENYKSKLQAVYSANLLQRFYFAPQKQMFYTIPLDIYIHVLLSYPSETKHHIWCKYVRMIASFLNKAGQLYNMGEKASALKLFDLHRASIHDLLLCTDFRGLFVKTTRKLTKAIEIATDMFHHRFSPEEMESIEIVYQDTMELEELSAIFEKEDKERRNCM